MCRRRRNEENDELLSEEYQMMLAKNEEKILLENSDARKIHLRLDGPLKKGGEEEEGLHSPTIKRNLWQNPLGIYQQSYTEKEDMTDKLQTMFHSTLGINKLRKERDLHINNAKKIFWTQTIMRISIHWNKKIK